MTDAPPLYGLWLPASQPPAFVPPEHQWGGPLQSAPVLCDTGGGATPCVARFEQFDEDSAPEWRTCCSEGWNITARVKRWTPLPPL